MPDTGYTGGHTGAYDARRIRLCIVSVELSPNAPTDACQGGGFLGSAKAGLGVRVSGCQGVALAVGWHRDMPAAFPREGSLQPS